MPKPLYRFIAFTLLLGLMGVPRPASAQADHLTWNEATELPDRTGGPGGTGAMAQGRNLGMAGPYVGVAPDGSEGLPENAHADVLVVAGGANFPVPAGYTLWGGENIGEAYKRYYDTVWVLSRKKDGDGYAYT